MARVRRIHDAVANKSSRRVVTHGISVHEGARGYSPDDSHFDAWIVQRTPPREIANLKIGDAIVYRREIYRFGGYNGHTGDVILQASGTRRMTPQEFGALNAGKEPEIGEFYRVKRSDGTFEHWRLQEVDANGNYVMYSDRAFTTEVPRDNFVTGRAHTRSSRNPEGNMRSQRELPPLERVSDAPAPHADAVIHSPTSPHMPGVRAGDSVSYQGQEYQVSAFDAVTNEVILKMAGRRTVTKSEFIRQNAGREIQIGEKYAITRTDGKVEYWWLDRIGDQGAFVMYSDRAFVVRVPQADFSKVKKVTDPQGQ